MVRGVNPPHRNAVPPSVGGAFALDGDLHSESTDEVPQLILPLWGSTDRAGEGGEPPSTRPRFAEASHFPHGAELIMKRGVKKTLLFTKEI